MAGFRAEPFVLIFWGLLLFAWILMLAANAALQQNCSSGQHTALSLGATVGYLGGPISCSQFYGFTWWITWYIFFLVVLIPALTAAKGLDKFRGGLIGLIALAVMLVGDATNTFYYWNHAGFSSTAKDRARTMLAGGIIASIALYVLLFLVGVADEKAEKVETTGEPTGETLGGRYQPKPGTEAAAPAGVSEFGQYNPTYEEQGGRVARGY